MKPDIKQFPIYIVNIKRSLFFKFLRCFLGNLGILIQDVLDMLLLLVTYKLFNFFWLGQLSSHLLNWSLLIIFNEWIGLLFFYVFLSLILLLTRILISLKIIILILKFLILILFHIISVFYWLIKLFSHMYLIFFFFFHFFYLILKLLILEFQNIYLVLILFNLILFLYYQIW